MTPERIVSPGRLIWEAAEGIVMAHRSKLPETPTPVDAAAALIAAATALAYQRPGEDGTTLITLAMDTYCRAGRLPRETLGQFGFAAPLLRAVSAIGRAVNVNPKRVALYSPIVDRRFEEFLAEERRRNRTGVAKN